MTTIATVTVAECAGAYSALPHRLCLLSTALILTPQCPTICICCPGPTLLGVALQNVDCTSYYELEQQEYARKGVNLTPELWLVKLMVSLLPASSHSLQWTSS